MRDDRNSDGKKDERASSCAENKGCPRLAADGFYTPTFSPEEMADLASRTDIGNLDDEISLLKVQIRRILQKERDNEGKGNFEVVRRHVDTICRAVKIRGSLAGKGKQGMDEVMETALTEVAHELGIHL